MKSVHAIDANRARELAAIILAADEPVRLAAALKAAEDALCDAAQFIDAVKGLGFDPAEWSEWDQEMRNKISVALAVAEKVKTS